MQFQYIAFYKPYGVLCQFTGEPGDKTLADYGMPSGVYAAGRLDKDSEGLLLLTDDGIFNQKITNPKNQKSKTYWVQVEKIPDQESLNQLQEGVMIKGGHKTLPCSVKIIEPSNVPERNPPIRFRKTIPTCWLELTIKEGKNRQVRRMTAAIGHPTLRLIRKKIGKLDLGELSPGEWKKVKKAAII
jgi:23S rRNA pseudouridine2457 synthase